MRNWIERLLFRPRSLQKALDPQKKVRVQGVVFVIRQIIPLDYLAGFQAVLQLHDLYRRGDPEKILAAQSTERVKRHYRDVFLSAIVYPKMTMEKPEPGRESLGLLQVDALFTNWQICEELYEAIMAFTYGKKKLRLLASQKNVS